MTFHFSPLAGRAIYYSGPAKAPPTPAPKELTVELEGSNTARCPEAAVTVERGSAICALARKLIAEGMASETILRIYRNQTLVFEPMAVGKWAGLEVRESDGGRTMRFVRHRER